MIVSLTPRPEFLPVPRVEVRVEPLAEYDGGEATDPGGTSLDGGSPAGAGAAVDGGSPATVTVDIPSGTDRVTLWRRSDGTRQEVRPVVGRDYTGTLSVMDVEPAPVTTSTYELECFSGTVPLGRVTLGSVVLPWAGEDSEVVIQQPLDPRLSVKLLNLSGSWPSLTRESDGDLVNTEGSSLPTYVGAGPLRGISGMAIDFGVATRQDAAKVWATLGTQEQRQLPIWLIRGPGSFAPRAVFVRVKALTEVDINNRSGKEWSRFQAVVDEVAAPAPALIAPSLRYRDLGAVFGLYSAIGAALPTYPQWASAYEYSGAAG